MLIVATFHFFFRKEYIKHNIRTIYLFDNTSKPNVESYKLSKHLFLFN